MNRRLTLVAPLLALFLATSALATTVGIQNVEYHTEEEVRAMYHQLNLGVEVPISYAVTPDLSGLSYSGRLSNASLEYGLNILNFVRYLAGLSYDITLNEDYITATQDASLVFAGNDGISHYPTEPRGINSDIYNSGYTAAAQSNLSAGFNTLFDSIVHAYMADSDAYNLSRLGHRRWILNPSLQETGFGFTYPRTTTSTYSAYSAMHIMGEGYNDPHNVSGVVWPAQTMPIEYFAMDYPWSYSYGTTITSPVTVTLTRQNDGAVWNFYSGGGTSDGYITVNNQAYGMTGCVIFRPDDIYYLDGDTFHVSLTGGVTASYTVSFIQLDTLKQVREASGWAQDELTVAYQQGYPVDLFPDDYTEDVTRGEFCYMLALFIKNTWGIPTTPQTDRFTDLGEDPADMPNRGWYILYLNSLGIIQGTSKTTFSPDLTISREEIATLMYRTAEVFDSAPINHSLTSFSDYSSISPWGLDGLTYMNQIGVINGVGNNLISPAEKNGSR